MVNREDNPRDNRQRNQGQDLQGQRKSFEKLLHQREQLLASLERQPQDGQPLQENRCQAYKEDRLIGKALACNFAISSLLVDAEEVLDILSQEGDFSSSTYTVQATLSLLQALQALSSLQRELLLAIRRSKRQTFSKPNQTQGGLQ